MRVCVCGRERELVCELERKSVCVSGRERVRECVCEWERTR